MPLNWRRTLSAPRCAIDSHTPPCGVVRPARICASIARETMSRVARSARGSTARMKRSPLPSSRYPPAPRKPSSSTVPVMRVCGPASRPVGWNCTISMSRSGRPGGKRHRQAVAALVARGRVVSVHGRAAAGGEQHRLRLGQNVLAGAHVDQQHARRARERRTSRMNSSARCSSSRAMPRAHTCSASRLMISMPVRSPLCTVRSNVCPANAF